MGGAVSSRRRGEKQRIRRPRRVVVMRHGESVGNVDPSVYAEVPDWQLELTERGREQARQAGRELKHLISGGPVFVYVSPYVRCLQTLEGVLEELDEGRIASTVVEPRLREVDFGNFQDPALMVKYREERARFGRFFYRFPCGESGADAYDRVSAWFDTLHGDISDFPPDATVLVVTHGITSRLILMRWFHWSVDCFEQLANPANAQLLVLDRDDSSHETGGGIPSFTLSEASKTAIRLPSDLGEKNNYHRHLTIDTTMLSHSQRSHPDHWSP